MEPIKFPHGQHAGDGDKTKEGYRSEIVYQQVKKRNKDEGREDATNGFRR